MIEPTNRFTTFVVNFIASHTPRCRDITRLLSEAMDRKLPLRTRIGIRLHFTICVWCKRYGEQLKSLRRYGLKLPQEGCGCSATPGLPLEAKKRLKDAIQRDQSSR